MERIYKSPLNGCGESAERIYIYTMDSDDEYWEISNMSHEEKCEYFDVFDETGYHIAPSAVSHSYEFTLTSHHVIITETLTRNV